MAQLEIRTEKGTLDLLQGAEHDFYITRQIHDLNNLQTRNADFSKTIQIPPTPNNTNILDAYLGVDSSQTIPCQIIIDGITVAPKARLQFSKVKSSNEEVTFDVTVLYGNFNLFDDIIEGNINEMNWADLAYEHTHPVYVAQAPNTEGLVTPIVDWIARGGTNVFPYTNNVEINAGGFFIYAKEIIDRIVNEAGYTTIYADNLPLHFSQIALACPITKFFEIDDPNTASTSAYVENTANQPVQNAAERAIFQNNPTGASVWNATLNQYDIDFVTNALTVQLSGTYDHVEQGQRPPSAISIYQNGTLVAELEVDGTVTAVPFFLSVVLSVTSGDTIYVEIESLVNQTLLQLLTGTTFSINAGGEQIDRTIQPSLYIPQIGKSQFITNILKLFNLVITTDDITNEVTFRPFKDIYTAQEQDLTQLLDVGASPIERDFSIASLGQTSRFEWESDDLARSDFNFSIEIRNQLLAKEVNTIDMEFSACDNSLIMNNFTTEPIPRAKIPNMLPVRTAVTGVTIVIQVDGGYRTSEDRELSVGMWINAKLGGNDYVYRVIEVTSIREGLVQTPIAGPIVGVTTDLTWEMVGIAQNPDPRLAIIQLYGVPTDYYAIDGAFYGAESNSNATRFLGNCLSAMWLDDLKMANITSNYYAEFLAAQRTPEVIKAWFNLPTAVFANLDFMRPVYVAEFNAFYYINKIEQFKPERKTRIELVRLSTLT